MCFDGSLQWIHGCLENSLSLDCGGDSEFVDTVTNVTWMPDNAYITTGSATAWSSPFSNSGQGLSNSAEDEIPRQLQTSRYFGITTPRKNCYNFVVTPRPYLVRAGFHRPRTNNGTTIFQVRKNVTCEILSRAFQMYIWKAQSWCTNLSKFWVAAAMPRQSHVES